MARKPRKIRDLRRVRWVPPTKKGMDDLYSQLEIEHRIDRIDARELLHEIKAENGLRADDDVAIDWCGNVYAPNARDDPDEDKLLGKLTERGAKRRRERERAKRKNWICLCDHPR